MKKIFIMFLAVLVFGAFASSASANHSWGGYHWARTSNPFTLKLGDAVSSTWDTYLSVASSDWSASSVLNTTVVTSRANPKNCRPTLGRVEVCNSKYGANGWMGIAQIWTSGLHITQAVTKMNDTYFNMASYNTPAWRQFVMCQEVGHVFGLDHQDEDFANANLGTCMDYTSNPTTNQHPNQHDYDELVAIYSHLDSSTTVNQTTTSKNLASEIGDLDSDWGKSVKKDKQGKDALFEKDLGNGHKVYTHVFWIQE